MCVRFGFDKEAIEPPGFSLDRVESRFDKDQPLRDGWFRSHRLRGLSLLLRPKPRHRPKKSSEDRNPCERESDPYPVLQRSRQTSVARDSPLGRRSCSLSRSYAPDSHGSFLQFEDSGTLAGRAIPWSQYFRPGMTEFRPGRSSWHFDSSERPKPSGERRTTSCLPSGKPAIRRPAPSFGTP